jgi:hypothetical protein
MAIAKGRRRVMTVEKFDTLLDERFDQLLKEARYTMDHLEGTHLLSCLRLAMESLQELRELIARMEINIQHRGGVK